MPEELVPSKGEATSICQAGLLNADDVHSLLLRNSCSSGFFFRSASAFHCEKRSGTDDVSGWLDKRFACCLLFSSWFALPVAAGGLLWGWGPGTVTAWCSTGRALYRRMSVCMAMVGKMRSDWSSPGLVTLQEGCPLSSAITSDFWVAHGLSFEYPSPRLVASNSYRVQSTRPVAPGWEYIWPLGSPPPWPLAAFSSSSAQWCSVNTTPSWGSARQPRRFTRVWRLEPARERFTRWMRSRAARPPYQVECSCQTTKALSLSRAPYTPGVGWKPTERKWCMHHFHPTLQSSWKQTANKKHRHHHVTWYLAKERMVVPVPMEAGSVVESTLQFLMLW